MPLAPEPLTPLSHYASIGYWLILSLPPSTNNLYWNIRGRGRVLTKAARTWKEDAARSARTIWKISEPLPGPVSVSLWFVLRRDRDIDNVKAVLDCLSGIAYADDKQITRLVIEKRRAVGSEIGRVEISVTPAGEEATPCSTL